jgi:Leucine-rich repeat (LRR) protein
MMMCDCNQLIYLPELPPHLAYLSCSMNQLKSLPSLPHGLGRLYFSNNVLESLPELPSTLQGMACTLPHTGQIFVCNDLTPEMVQQLNHEYQEWAETQSRERCMGRCSTYYEELMCLRWHPDRVDYLYHMGYKLCDM